MATFQVRLNNAAMDFSRNKNAYMKINQKKICTMRKERQIFYKNDKL